MVLVRIRVKRPDRITSGDTFTQRHTLQPKRIEQDLLSSGSGKTLASVKAVTGVKPQPVPALRKNEVVNVALGPEFHRILRPLGHAVDQHASD